MSKYQIIIQSVAQKQLKSLSNDLLIRIENKLNNLVNDPRPDGCKKLKGRKNQWRIRVGDYRIIYVIDDMNLQIKILEVGHRREIYD
jgi:mRNA interferase RelE/StbE